jgi:SAM-dependent methyltransferase
VDGADPDRWSSVAVGWAELWGGFVEPVWRTIADVTDAGRGSRILDVGCGGGDLLAWFDRLGAVTAGIDPAPGMVSLARERVPSADVRPGDAEHLPWSDASFDLVTSVNALQFADDTLDALAELARVTRPGGHIAIANWAEAGRNDLNTIEEAVAAADGEEPLPDGDLRRAGGLEELFTDGGLEVIDAGIVELPWEAEDGNALVRAVLLGEDPEAAPVVLDAAQPFRTADGGYRLVNAFRYAVARTAI